MVIIQILQNRKSLTSLQSLALCDDGLGYAGQQHVVELVVDHVLSLLSQPGFILL
jgi:hypothetical protein